MKQFIKLTIAGIAWGCTISMFIMLVGALTVGDTFFKMSANEFVKQAIGSMITGVAFVLPTFVYKKENLAKWVQAMIHMGIGFFVYFIVGFNVGWIPTNQGIGIAAGTVLVGLIFGFAIWFGFYLYYKQEAIKINQKIDTMKKTK